MRVAAKTTPIYRCKEGVIYELHSRNLQCGVFVKAKAGFIGIREKYGERFVFMERHWNTGAPFGTAKPLRRIGVVPKSIPLQECLGTMDKTTKRRVEPVGEYDKGWCFVDTGKASKKIKPFAIHNDELFRFLQGVEKRFLVKCKRCGQGFAPSRLDKA